MPEHDPHSSAIKTPKQLVIVVVLAFLVPITVIGLLSQLFTSTVHKAPESEQLVLERIKPVGAVVIAETTAPKGSLTGEQVYAQICKTCHEAGIAGAPKAGDKSAWAPRVAQGEKTLLQHAIAGFQGKSGVMPPKGGNPELTDEEVHRAMVYLANQVGAGWKEPPAPTATTVASAAPAARTAATAAAPAAPAVPPAVPAAAPAAPAAALSAAPTTVAAAAPAAATAAQAKAGTDAAAAGKAVYDQTCHVCHATGLAGSPKFGDKAAWAPRIAQGIDTLHKAAITGIRAMPPKGGNPSLSDAQVMAAVDYMTAAAK